MAKKSATDHVSHWKKKQPTKHINKRRKLKPVLQKFFNYIKSDSYMFAPFINPRSSLPSPPPASSGEVSLEPVRKKEKKLVDVVKEYLKCDTYMYAPLAMDSAYDGEPCRGNAETERVCGQMETIMEETTVDDEHGLTRSRDIECVNGLNSVRRIVVEHSLLQSERVKHIVHQNSPSLSDTEDKNGENFIQVVHNKAETSSSWSEFDGILRLLGEVSARRKPRKVVVE